MTVEVTDPAVNVANTQGLYTNMVKLRGLGVRIVDDSTPVDDFVTIVTTTETLIVPIYETAI